MRTTILFSAWFLISSPTLSQKVAALYPLKNTQYISTYSGIALPATFLNIKAKKINTTTVELSWKTTLEINNHGFEVQISFDSVNFIDIKFVNGAGNSDRIIAYSVTDIPGRTGTVFYRLKQIDVDGNSKLSNTVNVLLDKPGIIKLYPNPAKQDIIAEGVYKYGRIQLLDASSKLVKDIINHQQSELNINIGGLKSGFYFIRLMNENDVQIIKLIISN